MWFNERSRGLKIIGQIEGMTDDGKTFIANSVLVQITILILRMRNAGTEIKN